jgi:hypothetical protein
MTASQLIMGTSAYETGDNGVLLTWWGSLEANKIEAIKNSKIKNKEGISSTTVGGWPNGVLTIAATNH